MTCYHIHPFLFPLFSILFRSSYMDSYKRRVEVALVRIYFQINIQNTYIFHSFNHFDDIFLAKQMMTSFCRSSLKKFVFPINVNDEFFRCLCTNIFSHFFTFFTFTLVLHRCSHRSVVFVAKTVVRVCSHIVY